MERNEENISLTDTINRGEQTLIKLNYDLHVNTGIDKNLSNILKRTKRNEHDGLNISKFAILEIKSAAAFSKWINENLFINISPNGEQYSQVKILSNDDMRVLNDKENFLPILRMIDPSIDDFKFDTKAPFTGTIIVRVDENNRHYEHDLISDSAGVRDFFPLAIQIFKIVYQNKVVFADEMDHSLNPVLTDIIL